MFNVEIKVSVDSPEAAEVLFLREGTKFVHIISWCEDFNLEFLRYLQWILTPRIQSTLTQTHNSELLAKTTLTILLRLGYYLYHPYLGGHTKS